VRAGRPGTGSRTNGPNGAGDVVGEIGLQAAGGQLLGDVLVAGANVQEEERQNRGEQDDDPDSLDELADAGDE